MENEKSNIESTFKNVISKSAEVSKDVFSKAGDAVQNFSDKSVLKIELKQLKSKRDKLYTELGLKMSELLVQKDFNLYDTAASSKRDEFIAGLEAVAEIQTKIDEITSTISEKEKTLKAKSEKAEK